MSIVSQIADFVCFIAQYPQDTAALATGASQQLEAPIRHPKGRTNESFCPLSWFFRDLRVSAGV
jgi:hypothetical protein